MCSSSGEPGEGGVESVLKQGHVVTVEARRIHTHTCLGHTAVYCRQLSTTASLRSKRVHMHMCDSSN